MHLHMMILINYCRGIHQTHTQSIKLLKKSMVNNNVNTIIKRHGYGSKQHLYTHTQIIDKRNFVLKHYSILLFCYILLFVCYYYYYYCCCWLLLLFIDQNKIS